MGRESLEGPTAGHPRVTVGGFSDATGGGAEAEKSGAEVGADLGRETESRDFINSRKSLNSNAELGSTPVA